MRLSWYIPDNFSSHEFPPSLTRILWGKLVHLTLKNKNSTVIGSLKLIFSSFPIQIPLPQSNSYLQLLNYKEWQKESWLVEKPWRGVGVGCFKAIIFQTPFWEQQSLSNPAQFTACDCIQLKNFSSPKCFAMHPLVVSASPFTLIWYQKHMAVNSPTDGCRELNGSQGENLACRCMITPSWAGAAHKPCELSIYKMNTRNIKHVNVKDRDLLSYCILPAN